MWGRFGCKTKISWVGLQHRRLFVQKSHENLTGPLFSRNDGQQQQMDRK